MKISARNILFILCAGMTLSAAAQSLTDNRPLSAQKVAIPTSLSAKQRLQSLPALTPVRRLESVRTSSPRVYTTVSEAVAAAESRAAKPGTYYTHSSGYYHLVPGFPLGVTEKNDTILSERGILGYLDRDLSFFNRTPEADSLSWDFYGNQLNADTVVIRPYYRNDTPYYLEMPTLTATLGTADSSYQMGRYVDDAGKVHAGMIATALSAAVYNVDVDALSESTSIINLGTTWDDPVLFGYDAVNKPDYMEVFEAPAGGSIILFSTSFYMVTPAREDLSEAKFTVEWMVADGDQWVTRKKIKAKIELLARDMDFDLSAWLGTATLVEDENEDRIDFSTLIDEPFAVRISGPQDGKKWALLCQNDRESFPDSTRNTAYYIPSTGEAKDRLCQYVFSYENQSGEEVGTQRFNTSLNIYQFMVAPYIVIFGSDSMRVESALDFNSTGETRTFLLRDWYDTPGKSTLTAKVSEGADWLTVTQPAADGLFFKMEITASSKNILVPGRRAKVTLTDNIGYSRDFFIYQGDRAAADLAGVDEVEVAMPDAVKAVYDGDAFVIQSTGYTRAEVYDTMGRLLLRQALSADGRIPAASLSEGVYLIRLFGNGMTTVKVAK